MKRALSLGLALAMLIGLWMLPGCAQRSGVPSSKEEIRFLEGGTSAGDRQDAEAAEPAPPVQPPTREYGTAASYVSLEGPVTVRVNYPTGDIPALDQAIIDWAAQTAESFRAELNGEGGGAFNADYSSYEVDGQVVSVYLTGTLSTSHDSLPRDVAVCFNADRSTGAVLALTDLVTEEGLDTLRAMVEERSGAELADGEDFAGRWLLTAGALALYLSDGEKVEFTDEELQEVLAQSEEEQTIDPSKPMIALTFDDGPSTNTDHILDLLALYGGKATFFVVGSRVGTYAGAVSRAVEEGHEIGIHTWSHATLTKLSADQINAEIMDTQAAVQQYAGYTCAAVRPPGGSCNDTVKAVCAELGLFLTNWSIDTEDWKTRDADATYDVIMSQATDGAIILCHDLYAATAEAMERVIPELIDQGYQLVTVSELLSYSEDGIVPGQLYRHR